MQARAALAVILLAPALAGCAQDAPAPDVAATFYPLAFLAERMGGDLVIATLVPAGVEPHDWEPTPAEVGLLARTRLLLVQGASFEPWFDGVRDGLGADAPPVAVATAGVTLREADGALDPHTWLDPVVFAQQARVVADALAAAFPERADGIRERSGALVADLDALHAEFSAGLAACETRTIVANHDAYSYLASRYNFTLIAISGLSPEAEPSPDDVARAAEAAREANATIIFFEELVSDRVARVVADEVGAQTRVLSPLESAPAQGDYLSVMRASLASLREAMRCA